MNKLTAEEILKIVEENYSIDDFAHGEWLECETEVETSDLKELDEKRSTFHTENIKNKNIPYNSENEVWKSYQSMPRSYDVHKQRILEKLGLGKIVEIDQVGGESMGDHWHSVKHFVDHDVYIKTIGTYSSYEGTSFYNGYGKEVKPQEKTITVYN